MRVLAILGVKNEGAYVLEWLAHHRACGFTDFLIFSNDCSDGTDLILDRLQDLGHLTHVRNDGHSPEGPQWSMLKAADKHPLRLAADWILVLDIDEFVNIHIGSRTVTDLIAAAPQTTAFALTWRLFGNAGQIEMQDRPVTTAFTRAAPATLGWPWRAQMFKTLFKNDGYFRKLGVHRPRSPADQGSALWRDGSGRKMDADTHKNRLFSNYTQDNYQWVQLNHYPLGAVENYMVKADRGRANRDASAFDMGYWIERNLNQVEDRSILDSGTVRAAYHADPILRPLHAAAFAWRKARFAQLMQDASWRSLFGRILMTPPSRALTAEEAKKITQHVI